MHGMARACCGRTYDHAAVRIKRRTALHGIAAQHVAAKRMCLRKPGPPGPKFASVMLGLVARVLLGVAAMHVAIDGLLARWVSLVSSRRALLKARFRAKACANIEASPHLILRAV